MTRYPVSGLAARVRRQCRTLAGRRTRPIRRASRRGCGHVSRWRCFRIPRSGRSCFWGRSGEHPVAGVRGGPGDGGGTGGAGVGVGPARAVRDLAGGRAGNGDVTKRLSARSDFGQGPPRSANACHSRGQGIPVGLVAAEPARPARFAPGPSRKTLMTVTFRPHRVAMSSGSDVRTVTGPGAAKAVALSIASIACR